MSAGGVVSRRKALAAAGTFLITAACNPDKLFGPKKYRPVTNGAAVYCGWANPRPEWGLVPGTQCPTQHPWADLKTRDRVPALGEYDERDPAVTAWRLEQMQRGGIDYVTYQIEWRHDSHELLTAHCAENHPADSPVSFCLSFFDVLDGSSDSYLPTFTQSQLEDSWRAYARAIKPFTRLASYLREGDRPVLFFGYGHRTSSRFLEIVRQEIPDVYLVATCCTSESFMGLKSKGFDAFTEYLLYSDTWDNVAATYRARWEVGVSVAKATGISYWVPTTCGYNSAAWGSPSTDVFEPTPSQLTEHLSEARQFARENEMYTSSRTLLYAWNEFGEGGALEPMADISGNLHRGDEMLMAHKAAA